MKIKSITGLVIVSVFAVGGIQAMAKPTESANTYKQPDAVLLCAKIENAIAELPGARTQENIQNAAFFILAKHDGPLEIKVAAIDTAIGNAQTLGDQLVVSALGSIELVANVEENNAVVPKTNSGTKNKPRKIISTPPSFSSSGGSDY